MFIFSRSIEKLDIPTILFFIIWFSLFFRALYNIFFGKKKRKGQPSGEHKPYPSSEQPEHTGDPDTWGEQDEEWAEMQDAHKSKQEDEEDVAAQFERMLKRNTEADEARRKAEEAARETARVNPKRQDEQRVRQDRDVLTMKDGSDRIRRDGQTKPVKSDADSQRIKRDSDSKRVHHDKEALHDTRGRVHTQDEAYSHDKGRMYYDPDSDYSYDEEHMNAQTEAQRAELWAKFEAQKSSHKPKVKFKHSAIVQGFVMSQILDKPRALKPYTDEKLL